MSGPVDIFRDMHAHRRWARDQFIGATKRLPPETHDRPFEIGRGSLLRSLVHLHEADFIWIEVLHHEAKNDIDDARFRTVAELEAALAQMDPRWNTYIEHVTPASLETEVQRFSPALNKIYSIRVRDVLTHVCTHNLYTLAQAANIIRRLGGEVPPTDFPMWVLAGRPG